MHSSDACTKTVDPVIDVLQAKHPKAPAPSYSILEAYPSRPLNLVPIDPIEDTVIDVAR